MTGLVRGSTGGGLVSSAWMALLRGLGGTGEPVIAVLAYDIVSVTDWGQEDSAWVKIAAPGSREGYIARQFVRSPIDYRACFRKSEDGWMLAEFIAGD